MFAGQIGGQTTRSGNARLRQRTQGECLAGHGVVRIIDLPARAGPPAQNDRVMRITADDQRDVGVRHTSRKNMRRCDRCAAELRTHPRQCGLGQSKLDMRTISGVEVERGLVGHDETFLS
jgi:hypothetical protein